MKLDGGNDGGDMIQFAPQQKDVFGKASKDEMSHREYNDITKLNDPYPDLSKQTNYYQWKQNIIKELDKRGIKITGDGTFYVNHKLINNFKKKDDFNRPEAIEKTLRNFHNSSDRDDINKLVKELEKFNL